MVFRQETNQSSESWFDDFKRSLLHVWSRPEFQFATIARIPIFIEIKNDRDDATAGVMRTIKVRFVEATLWINREMSFKIEQTEEKMLVQREAQNVQNVQITLLRARHFARFQPHDMVTADVFTNAQIFSTTNSSTFEFAEFPSFLTLLRKLKCSCDGQ